MGKVVSVTFGEIALKGKNRGYFENKLITRIRLAIKEFGETKVYRDQGKIYIECDEEQIDSIIKRVRKVFGIVYISECYKVEKNVEAIEEICLKLMKERDVAGNTFKVFANRADKDFPMKSPELAINLGGYILDRTENLEVDIHNPMIELRVDIRGSVYVYTDRIKGYGGLPVGTNGKGLLLLSGGIDSPVAGFMMARRGLEIDAVHFHSYPFTNERSEQKAIDLAKRLSMYSGEMRVYSINILDIQKEINANCPSEEMTILTRRFMMKIAEKIAKGNKINALITGESLGQVASQTIQGITVTNASVELPVLRPLIAIDKTDITEMARDIETYETSILPHDDCCTVFLPKSPVIKPRLKDIERSERGLDVEGLIEKAMENIKVIDIKL